MNFEDIVNAKLSKELDRPMMKKEAFPVSAELQTYLKNHGRDIKLPIAYKDLLNYRFATSLRDKKGKLTHWETAVYDLKEMEFLKEGLIKTYAILKTEGNLNYHYEKVGERYKLYSVGLDRIENTTDDIYPTLPSPDSTKIGFIKKK